MVRIDGDALRAEREDGPPARIPLRQLDAVHLYGRIGLTNEVISRCAEEGINLAWFRRGGRFVARLAGPTSGNVLLRCAQIDARHDEVLVAGVARSIVRAKLLNSRVVLLDLAKDDAGNAKRLRAAADSLLCGSDSLEAVADLDVIRGVEGQAAKTYFGEIGRNARMPEFRFSLRTRRPALDPMNALLSFLYALLRSRCVAGAEAVGLDPQVGFLHALRPGRDSLALDLMEEMRAPFADRLALTLVNRRQLTPEHFETRPGGSVSLTDDGRNIVLGAWDAHLSVAVPHRAIDRDVHRRFVPHVQAAILARHLRGEMDAYIPYRTVAR